MEHFQKVDCLHCWYDEEKSIVWYILNSSIGHIISWSTWWGGVLQLTCTGWMRPWLSVRAMTLRAKCRTLDWVWKNASNTCFKYSCIMELLIPEEMSPISFRSSCLDSFFPATIQDMCKLPQYHCALFEVQPTKSTTLNPVTLQQQQQLYLHSLSASCIRVSSSWRYVCRFLRIWILRLMEDALSARMPLYKFFTSGINIWLGCMITRKPEQQTARTSKNK